VGAQRRKSARRSSPRVRSDASRRATPLQFGERTAFITLHTDAPPSPEIVLKLHIVGSRRPPFMGQARGELNYIGDVPVGDLGKIYAYNMEHAGSTPSPPIVKCEALFVEVGPAKLLEENPYEGPDFVTRKYVFDARVARDPLVDQFAGTILVIDPWDAEHVERTRFHGEILPPLRAIPSRIILHLKNSHDQHAGATIVVKSKSPARKFVVSLEGSKETPLTIGEIITADGGRMASFRVALRAGQSEEGEYKIHIGTASGTDRVTVPVSVRRGASNGSD
jgi:hypothetical protein